MKVKDKKRILTICIGLVCVGITLTGTYLSQTKESIVTDEAGAIIAHITWKDSTIQYECEAGSEDYVDLACQEAINALCDAEHVSKDEAKERIAKGNYTITTSFDREIFEALKTGSNEITITADDAKALAVSDGQGHLLAAYTETRDQSENQLTKKVYAGSTIKPLSTYGPGIERNVITWSQLYEDSPFIQEDSENGERDVWPVNVEEYTYDTEPVANALQESNNAITVKILNDIGMKNVCDYMEHTLNMSCDMEQQMIEENQEKYKKEILSGLGLGYLDAGVSVKEMLEDYQAFAQSGIRYKLSTVKTIEDSDGQCIYKEQKESDRIFSGDTAYILNRMLHNVVENGTAQSAKIDGIDVCGKTGTSENYRDNWFIGMTPEYVCAVWYSHSNQERWQNEAINAFRCAMRELPSGDEKTYPVSETVVEKEYCEKTGLLAGEHCTSVKKGYYKKNELPDICEE